MFVNIVYNELVFVSSMLLMIDITNCKDTYGWDDNGNQVSKTGSTETTIYR